MIGSALSRLEKSPVKVCHFASGVSNSSSCNPSEYEREKNLLKQKLSEIDKDVVFVYYSTCSVYDEQSESIYKKHKLEMEELVSGRKFFHIFRLPQVVGVSRNKFTLTNYLRDCIIEERLISIQTRAMRNLIDVEHVAIIANSIISNQDSVGRFCNIANPISVGVLEIVFLLECALSKRSRYVLVDAGSSYPIDVTIASKHAKLMGVEFDGSYVKNLIDKYYFHPKVA